MVGAWLLLATAIGVEVGSTALMPRTQGFRDPFWAAVVLVGYGISIWLLALVVERIPVSITYAVWAGVGTAGIAAVGVLLLGETLDLVKVVALLLIIAGVLLLNLHGAH